LRFAGAEIVDFTTTAIGRDFSRTAAHLALCAAAIFRLADADIVRFAGAEPADFATTAIGCDVFRRLAHRAFCAAAILRRELADTIRFGWVVLVAVAAPPAPFKDSIPEINWSNFSISTCAWLRFSRSSRNALSRFDIVTPLGYFDVDSLYKTGVACLYNPKTII